MNRRLLTAASGVVFGTLALVLLWHWQPRRQVALHFDHFLDRCEARNWSRAARMIDDGYKDRWGFDKTALLRESREIGRQFFALEIVPSDVRHVLANHDANTNARIEIGGNGTAVAEYAMNEFNRAQPRLAFKWRKASWKPWDWQLVEIDSPDLQLGQYREFH